MACRISFVAAASCACVLLAGCTPAHPYDSEFKAQFEAGDHNQGRMFASSYFPESYGEPQVDCGKFQGKLIGEVEEKWYPQQWKAAREPSLYLISKQKPPPEFALRFSYIPSFDSSVFIRVLRDSDGFKLVAKEMSGAGGYDPGTIKRSKEVRLSAEQVADLQRRLAGGLFGEPPATCNFGLDGSEWIFELVDEQGYRMVKRWSPSDGAGFDLGQHLLRLSGWE